MAIQKSKTLANGSEGNYWKIVKCDINKVTLTVEYHIAVFKDQSYAQDRNPHLGLVKHYKFPIIAGDLDNNMIAFGYTKIIEKAESMVTHGLDGEPLDEPFQYDSDLADGEAV